MFAAGVNKHIEAHGGHLAWNMAEAITLVNGGDPAAAKKRLGLKDANILEICLVFVEHHFLPLYVKQDTVEVQTYRKYSNIYCKISKNLSRSFEYFRVF